jgi:hypothetical protein
VVSREKARARAAQMYAEMLGIVCHSQYYNLGNQKSFIVHFDGLHASIYWASFTSEYLRIVQSVGLDKLSEEMQIELNHTQFYNLLDPLDRTKFIKHFFALVRYLADGYGDVGHLRRDGNSIHRTLPAGDSEKEAASSWMVLDYDEEEEWLKEHGGEYES